MVEHPLRLNRDQASPSVVVTHDEDLAQRCSRRDCPWWTVRWVLRTPARHERRSQQDRAQEHPWARRPRRGAGATEPRPARWLTLAEDDAAEIARAAQENRRARRARPPPAPPTSQEPPREL
ncbi:hypothetical protein QJS66_17345 [Kocuria rhizophila]|nr:hypothetical protein QJS66_17345 [Kocuria rhizophila]